MCRNRAVVDDATTARRLRFHHAEGRAGAEKYAGQVGVDDGTPIFDAELVNVDWRPTAPGVIEQHIEAAIALANRIEERGDARRVAHITGNGKRVRAALPRLVGEFIERCLAASGQHHAIAVFKQPERRRAADAAARASYQRHLVCCGHNESPCRCAVHDPSCV